MKKKLLSYVVCAALALSCLFSVGSIKAAAADNYKWIVNPNVTADDIIVSDDHIDRYPLFYPAETEKPSDVYSIIKKNGKYALIDYSGKVYNNKFYNSGYIVRDLGELGVYEMNPTTYEGEFCWVNYDQSGKCKITVTNIQNGRGSAGWESFYYDNNNKSVHVVGPGGGGSFSKEVFIDFYGKKINKAVLISNKLKIDSNSLYGCYYNGKFTVPMKYNNGIMSMYNDMIALYDSQKGKWGYFNGQTGKKIIDFICNGSESNYSNPFLFSDGLAAVYTDKGCGYYNTEGKIIIPVGTFEAVKPVHNGNAWVKKNGKWGVISINANSDVPKPAYDDKMGDIDGDGSITSADSLLILRQSVGLENFSSKKIKLCDVDGDKNVTSADALEVLRYSVGLSTQANI